jgi:hypothetical protein
VTDPEGAAAAVYAADNSPESRAEREAERNSVVPTDLPDVLEDWRTTIDLLDQYRAELAWNGDTPRLAFGLDRVRDLRRALGDLERAIETDVAELMDGKTETVDGLGTIERRKGTTRKSWQSEDLLRQLVRDAYLDAVDDLEPGDDPSMIVGRVFDTVTDCVPITPSLGWRVTALRSRGIDQ